MHDPRPPSPRPFSALILRSEAWALAFVAAMAALRLAVAALAPLSADEGYYWQWTRPLQLSYFDHPPMVAYWIWAGLHLAGDSALGVRLLSVLGACVVTLLVWLAARRAFGSAGAAALAAVWLNASVLFGSGGILMTPDAPLLVFWTLALLAMMRLIDDERPADLYLLGLALGLGAISKYTMALLVPGLLAAFLLFPRLRRWWATPHLYLAALLALACTTPVLLWNAGHRWASFAKQLGHAFAGAPPKPLPSALAWLGSQAGLVTPLIFAFCLWGMGWALWAGWREQRPKWFLLGATSLPILLFFLNQSLHGGVQAHWAGPAYLSGMIAAAGAWCQAGAGRRAGKALRAAFVAAPALGVAMTLLVFLQAATAALPIPIKADALKRLGGWRDLAAAVEAERLAHPGVFLLTPKHEPTGVVSFYLPDHAPVFLQGHIRPSYYTAAEVAALKGRDAILITRTRQDASRDLAPFFAHVGKLRDVPLTWGGRTADLYSLYLCEGYKGGALVQGDGLDGALDLR